MSLIRIMTNFNIELEFPAAPFHRRLLAWILDMILLILFSIIYFKIILLFNVRGVNENFSVGALIFLGFILIFYHLICEIFLNGQSLGKKITGIRVVNENGGQPSVGQYVIRWVIRTSDLMAIAIVFSVNRVNNAETFINIGIPMILFFTDVILMAASKKNQRLGDMLAHTLLIRTSEKHSINDTVFLQMNEDYVPSFPQVMRLSDRDINSLKGILDTARKKGDYNLAEMASEKIKNHLKIQTTLAPFDFLDTLMQDYNYLASH